jgi:hypothetical protein
MAESRRDAQERETGQAQGLRDREAATRAKASRAGASPAQPTTADARVEKEPLIVDAPPAPENDDWSDEDDIDEIEEPVEPLTTDEVLKALVFTTNVLAEAEDDDYYQLDATERDEMVPFLTEQLNRSKHLIRAVRSLDFFSGWGLVAWAVIRRGIHYWRKHFEGRSKTPVDQAGPEVRYGRPL